MATARKASATQSKLGMLVYGEQFTGKSTQCLWTAYLKRPDGKPMRVLILDAEVGSVDDYLPDLEADGVNLDNIYIVYTQSLGEVRQYISKVRNNEDIYELDDDGEETMNVVLDSDGNPFRPDVIIVDGSTILNMSTKTSLIEFSKKRNKVKAEAQGLIGEQKLVKIEGAGLEIKDYSTINFKGQDLILDLMGCGAHYIVTARETDEKQSIKDADGKITSVSTGRKIPEGFKELAYNVKTVIRMHRDENDNVCGYIEKDRTGVHKAGEDVVDFSILDYQAVIDKTAGHKAFTVKNSLSQSVKIDEEIYKKELLKEAGNVTVEDIKNDDNEAEASVENNVDTIKTQIKATLTSMRPTDKANARKKLTEANLPTDFTKVNDIEVLNQILATIA